MPEALKGVNVSVPNINAEKLDPVSNPNYKKAHLTMLILIKDALVAAADAHMDAARSSLTSGLEATKALPTPESQKSIEAQVNMMANG